MNALDFKDWEVTIRPWEDGNVGANIFLTLYTKDRNGDVQQTQLVKQVEGEFTEMNIR